MMNMEPLAVAFIVVVLISAFVYAVPGILARLRRSPQPTPDQSDEAIAAEIRLSEDRTRVCLSLPNFPMVNIDGIPRVGISLSHEAAQELGVQLIRSATIAESYTVEQ